MSIMLFVTISLFVACTLQVSAQTQVSVEVNSQPFYIIASPISVELKLVTQTEKVLVLDDKGILSGINFSLLDEKGGRVTEVETPATYPTIVVENPTILMPGESVCLVYDLHELYKITQPGKYTFRVVRGYDQQLYAEKTINILPADLQMKVSFHGFCAHLGSFSRAALPHGFIVDGNLTIRKVTAGKESSGIVAIEGLMLEETHASQNSRIQAIYGLPTTVSLERAVLDYTWHLWAVLHDGDKRCLVIWSLTDRTYQFIIPWTTEQINLGSTRLFPLHTRDCYVAIAGIKGKEQISTLNLSQVMNTPGEKK